MGGREEEAECVRFCNIKTEIKRWKRVSGCSREQRRGSMGSLGGSMQANWEELADFWKAWIIANDRNVWNGKIGLKESKNGAKSEKKQKTVGWEECGKEGEKPPHVKTNLHYSCSAPFRNSSFIRTRLLHCSNAVCVYMSFYRRESDVLSSACFGVNGNYGFPCSLYRSQFLCLSS